MITYETDYATAALGTNWTLHTDGYFYYNKVLNLEESTSALFDQIRMPTTLTNGSGASLPTTNPAGGTTEGTEGVYSVNVSAQAVQAQGAKPSFTAVEAMTVEEIAAWFTTCGMST